MVAEILHLLSRKSVFQTSAMGRVGGRVGGWVVGWVGNYSDTNATLWPYLARRDLPDFQLG